jgi:hypothetical protein
MIEPTLAKAIEKILLYMWDDEMEHFEEMKAGKEDTSDHIFRSLVSLERWFKQETGRSIENINEEYWREQKLLMESNQA